MEFESVATIKKEISEEEFLRRVLIELAGSSETPVDVVKAKFGEVKERIREVIHCKAHVETDYTASIGYDRIEEYWDKEKKTEYINGEKYERYVDVKKTRTVTDWKPYSGHISGNTSSLAFNDDETDNSEVYKLLSKALRTFNMDNLLVEGEATVNSEGLSYAKYKCAKDIEFSVKFPGDHYKDDRYNSDIEVLELFCYKLPFYEVRFTYDDKEYYACGFACGEVDVYTELPPNNTDIVKQAAKDTERSRNFMELGWLVFGGLFIMACINIAIKVYWTCVFPAVMLVAAIILHVMSDKTYKNRLKALKEDNFKLKRKELDETLTKYGFDKVNENEEILFEYEKKSESYAASHERKGVKTAAIWSSIATVILIIVSIFYGMKARYTRLHSPEQFTFKITGKTQECKPGYWSGKDYYISLDCEVTANKIGADVDSIYVYIYVYSDNVEIGYISSHISYMELGAGETKTYTIHLEKHNPEEKEDTFFIELYNNDFSDFTYKFEIEEIRFSDDARYDKKSGVSGIY